MRSWVCLFAVLLIYTGISVAVNDPSGRWSISYQGQNDQISTNGMINMAKAGSTLYGGLDKLLVLSFRYIEKTSGFKYTLMGTSSYVHLRSYSDISRF